MTRIALINIGSELLSGRTVNTNASSIGLMLQYAGFSLQTIVVIHDEGEVIEDTVNRLSEEHEVVLITGGLGPTTDDITKKTLQKVFGGDWICHEPTLARISQFLIRRNMPMVEQNRLQAYVPSSCDVIENEMGTAPGMAFYREGRTIISMPGVPFEMEHVMRKGVLPLLQAKYLNACLKSTVVRTWGIPESRIAEKMEPIAPGFDPRIEVAYLPSFDGTKIELKIKGNESDAVGLETAVRDAQMKVRDLLKAYVYSLEDLPPVRLLARHLLENDMKFTVAESCTGGAIAASLVEQSGISSVFKGGIIAYSREMKTKLLGVPAEMIASHGVVSEEVAEAMAVGAKSRFESHSALSITGIAEAGEGEQTQAWIGFADSSGPRSMHIKLYRDRKVNIQYATQAALIFAYRCLSGVI